MTERVCRSDGNLDGLTGCLQYITVDVIDDERRSVLRLKDPTILTITEMFSQLCHCFGIDIDLPGKLT